MTAVKITPTKLSGVVQVPPSKSLAHRAIICASLAKGISRIDNIEYSKDIQATIKAMQSLGTKIEKYDDYLIIDGTTTYTKQNSEIDCEESGSTLRFMVPIAIVEENKAHFVGRGNLGKRPLNTFYEIFERQNIGYLYKEDILDLYVIGKLKPDHYKVPGNISSQFITGLLFALPLLDGDSIIEITSPLESKGYIDLTLQMLNQYVINAKRLRIKECDRIIATRSQLNELGGTITELPDGMTIRGVNEFTGGNCSSFADHRIAMMLAIAATRSSQPVVIDNMECVEKSYPSFWEDYQSLGGIIDVIDVEK